MDVPEWLPIWLTADDNKPSSPWWDVLVQYSVLGIAVAAFGWLLFKIFTMLLARSSEELAREVARGDRLEQENRALNAAMQDKAIPALLSAANTLAEATELLRDQQRERDYLRRQRDGDFR